jgi:hypothetical protein
MEQRLKNLEDVCELITKEIVEQSKSMIEMNKSLISEIRCLREAYVKQDDDFEEFKNLLRKIYELNRQQSMAPGALMPPFFPPPPPHPSSQVPQSSNNMPPGGGGGVAQQLPPNFMDPINQSMMNNMSFQSERTPFNMNQLPPSFAQNLNLTGSNYSIPSSASGMNMKQNLAQQQQQQQPSVFNPQQPPPSVFNLNKNQQPPVSQQFPQQQSVHQAAAAAAPQQPFKFGPAITTTSTPQQQPPFTFSKSSPQIAAPVVATPNLTSTTSVNSLVGQAVASSQQQQQVKPPLFEFSPAKPSFGASATNTPSANAKQQSAVPSPFPGIILAR